MRVVTAPEALPSANERPHFLAGGITDCPDWQADVIAELADRPYGTLLNPRRPHFDVRDPSASHEQVEWERRALHRATSISFWFPEETLCPITLYELGYWSAFRRPGENYKPIVVGIHPGYARKFDVEFQTALCRPDVDVVYDLSDLCDLIDREAS